MYEYDFHTYSVRRKRSKRKVIFSFVCVVIVSIFLLLFIVNNNQTSSKQSQVVLSETTEKEDTNSRLGVVVRQALLGSEGSYSIVIKQLKTGEYYYLNEHREYESASLYKLWVMATVYKQIQAGKLEENEPLTADVVKLNKSFGIASDSAELSDGELDFTIGSALRQMITISHNYAALALTTKVKLSSIDSFLKQNNLRESKVGTGNSAPITTAYDIAEFLEKLFKGELGDHLNTEKMIDLLKAQQLNKKLPKYLPESALVAHKTGELGQFSHDAGIIYTPNGPYIIVVMSKSMYPPSAEERIAEISRAVYEYFIR